MEDLKLKFSIEEVNFITFDYQSEIHQESNPKLDYFMKNVISDYITFSKALTEIDRLNGKIKDLSKQLNITLQENTKVNQKLDEANQKISDYLEVNGDVTSNIELLQRISLLEQALYNLGKDPSKIK